MVQSLRKKHAVAGAELQHFTADAVLHIGAQVFRIVGVSSDMEDDLIIALMPVFPDGRGTQASKQ